MATDTDIDTAAPAPIRAERDVSLALRHPEVGRIAVVGLGLIGFSLALALARTGVTLLGVEPDSAVRRAVFRWPDTPFSEGDLDALPGARLREADLVVLAVPMKVLAPVADAVAPCLRPGATFTDTASLKVLPLRELEASAPLGVGVVGGHPMAGRERGGAENASAQLFEGHPWALTAGSRTRPVDLERVTWMARQVGARPVQLDAQAHDRAIAVTSQLPYLAASALARATERLALSDPAVVDLIGTGWRDATRLADQPDWMDTACADNAPGVAEAMRLFHQELGEALGVLSRTDDQVATDLKRAGSRGRMARRHLLDEPSVEAREGESGPS